MKKKKKLLLIIGGIVVVATLVIVNLLMDTSKATSVQTDDVTRRDVTEKVSASGRIQPQTKVDITSEINGEIIGLFVNEGDRVKMGDLLVVLDTVQLRSDVDQARYMLAEVNARLDGAKSRLEQTDEDYQLLTQLYEKNLKSETEFKAAKYQYYSAKSSYDATKAQSSQAQSRYEKQLDNLDKAKIVAPMTGVITFLDCEAGEIAAAQTGYTQGKTLMTIANLEVFEVEVEVDETEINKIELQQVVEIEVDASPDTTFEGAIVEVGNTAISASIASEQGTNFRVKVIFADPRVKLRPGMSATVDVTTSERKDVLTIPYSAVVMRSFDMDSLEAARANAAESSLAVSDVHAAESSDEEQDETDSSEIADDDKKREELKGIFVVRDGTARFVEIETGIADQKRIEVVSGISETDTVISGPYRVLRNIKDSEEVEIMEKHIGESDDE